MTGGIGFSRDAVSSSQSNRANRTSNQAKFKDGQKTYLTGGKTFKFKEVSEEELAKIKNAIHRQAKAEQKRKLMIALGLAVLVLVIGLFFML